MSRSWQWFHRWGSSPYVFRVGRRWQIMRGRVQRRRAGSADSRHAPPVERGDRNRASEIRACEPTTLGSTSPGRAGAEESVTFGRTLA